MMKNYSLLGQHTSLKNDTNFYLPKVRGEECHCCPQGAFQATLRSFYHVLCSSTCFDILVFHVSNDLLFSKAFLFPASQPGFLSFPPCLGLHSVMTTLPYIGLYCRHWRCMWYERKAQTLEVGRWVASLGLCGSDEVPPCQISISSSLKWGL